MILSVGVFGFFQPLLRSVQVSERLAATTHAPDCPASQVATLGHATPSLVFLIGTDLRRLASGAEAADFLEGEGCRVLLVERRLQGEFLDALDEATAAPALRTRVSGFDLNEARRVDIGVYVTGR
jgi:hypothetical protein